MTCGTPSAVGEESMGELAFGVLGGGSRAVNRQFQELPDLSVLVPPPTGPGELQHIQATWILVFFNARVLSL